MDFEDIVVGNNYMVYEDSFGQVTVLAKAVVDGSGLVWFKSEKTTGIGEAKYFSPIPLTKEERAISLAHDLSKVLTVGDVIDLIDELIDDIEYGRVVWHVGRKETKEDSLV